MTENNSIVTKVLAIAEERESARLKKIEDALLEFLQSVFNDFLETCSEWKTVDGFSYTADLSLLRIKHINKYDLEAAGKNIGLKVKVVPNSSQFTYQIITTKNTDSNIMSPAQKMLEDFNTKLLARINLHAENSCKEILYKLNSGDFTSKKDILQKKWIITVTDTSIPISLTSYFFNRANTILTKNGFNEVHFTAGVGCDICIPFDEEYNEN